MRPKFKQALLGILPIIINFGSCFLLGHSFSNTTNVRVDAFSQVIANQSISNYENKVFSELCDENSVIDSLFANTYGSNFSNYFDEIISYIDDNGKQLSFDLSFGSQKFNDFKVADARAYSNNENLKRFETVNINLFKTPNRSEESNTFGLDGFIYIPDYLADLIIKNSSEINTYLDLLPNLSQFSVSDRNAFLERNSIYIKQQDNIIGRFKIANIFHVNGFDAEAYDYNDKGTGLLFNNFFGNYIVGSSNKFSSFKKNLVTIYDAKKLIINKEINNFINVTKNSNSKMLFYFKGSNESMTRNLTLIRSDFMNKKILLPCLIGAIVLLSLSFIFVFLNSKKCSKIFLLSAIGALIILVAVVQLLSITIFLSNFSYLLFYNMYFNIPNLLIFIILAIMLVGAFKNDNRIRKFII